MLRAKENENSQNSWLQKNLNLLNKRLQPQKKKNPTAGLEGCHSDDGNVHSHVGEGDVVLKVTGEVRLDEPLGLRERLVSATAEEGDARETQQCGNQGAVWYPTQTAHTAVITTC